MTDPTNAVEHAQDDGPECDTCGKTTCPDAQLPAFSEPKDCELASLYRAFRDTKDCDYGCGRDFTNQGIRLEVAPAVERIVVQRVATALGKQAAQQLEFMNRVLEKAVAEHLTAEQALVERVEAVLAAPDDTQWWPVRPYMDPPNDDEVVEVQVIDVSRVRAALLTDGRTDERTTEADSEASGPNPNCLITGAGHWCPTCNPEGRPA